jgi:hypothetical protein
MDEVIQRFHEHGVRYLLIGGQAVRLAGRRIYRTQNFSSGWARSTVENKTDYAC